MLDDQTADRILSGLVAPADAPPGYVEVTRLVLSLRELADRLPGEPATLTLRKGGGGIALPPVSRRVYVGAALAGAGLALVLVRLRAFRPG